MAPHTRILLGLSIGTLLGVVANFTVGGGRVESFVSLAIEPLGRIWLNALIMIVIPLVLATLALGVAGLGGGAAVGRVGALTLGLFVVFTTIAALVGLVAARVVVPGRGFDAAATARLMETYRSASQSAMGLAKGGFGVGLFVDMVPRNPIAAMAGGEMLAVIVFALFIGVGLTRIPRAHAAPLVNVLEAIAQVSVAIIELVMRAAPIGVFALIFSVTARFGFGIVVQLLQYVLTVVVCLGLFNFVFYPAVVKLVAGRSPGEFLRQIRVVMLTAFSTSSSNATLPAALRVTRNELGVRPQIAGFVVPLGATMNQNGSALFQSVAVLFVAQVFGLSLSIAQYAIVATLVVVTALGTAGVPGGAIPLLMMVLATVGVPMEGVAIVLGVDRIVDMCRTVVNVTGDIVAAAIVDRFAGPLAAQEVPS